MSESGRGSDPNQPVLGRVFIGGTWYDKSERLESLNPATGLPLGSVPVCNAEDVSMAVKAAREALPGWSALPVHKRFGYFEVLRNVFREEGDALASLITQENGKPLPEAHFVEVLGCLDFLSGLIHRGPSYLADKPARTNNPLLLAKNHFIRRLPLGVAGVISPWNLPLSIPLGQILPALAAGNTVVFKPSEHTPLVGVKIAGLFERAGFPPGVFNLVTGGGETGRFLVESDLDALLFTGSTKTGRAIQASAAPRWIHTQMELGGKDAFLVLDDANPERTVNGAVWGACFGSGQTCSSAERVFVPASMAHRFEEEVTGRAATLRVGDGMADGVDMGPMISEEQRQAVARQVDDAVAKGARLLCGGKAVDGPGFFYRPTVLADVPLDCALMREETFGPVIPIAAYENIEQALDWCNDSPYGLSASIWTADTARGAALAKRLDVGSVWINDTSYSHSQPWIPWGGQKASGRGRTHWLGSLHDLTTPQAIGVDGGKGSRQVWWFPYTGNSLELARRYRFFGKEGVASKLLNLGPLVKSLVKAKLER